MLRISITLILLKRPLVEYRLTADSWLNFPKNLEFVHDRYDGQCVNAL